MFKKDAICGHLFKRPFFVKALFFFKRLLFGKYKVHAMRLLHWNLCLDWRSGVGAGGFSWGLYGWGELVFTMFFFFFLGVLWEFL